MTHFKFGRVGAWATAAVVMLGASSATSATLGLPVLPAPEISGSGNAVNDAVILVFDFLAEDAVSTAPAAASGLDVRITGLFGLSTAALNVGPDPAALFLGGVQADLGYEFSASGPDSIEILFSGLSGSAAASFGDSVLAVITGEFGNDETVLFDTGFGSTQASIVINPVDTAVIPLPATLPLMASALLSAFAISRRRGCA
ncbi:hypothetical protein [Roseovarius sp. D22-M7]|uniref:hypothetical protein n=1 Tax=Roseovarius sp. D22-M7 TaxID=3127116 RepID=UPI00300F8C25